MRRPLSTSGLAYPSCSDGGLSVPPIEYQRAVSSVPSGPMIYEGPNTSKNPDEAIPGFEIIRARRADFLRAAAHNRLHQTPTRLDAHIQSFAFEQVSFCNLSMFIIDGRHM